jgi:hypothetical protein
VHITVNTVLTRRCSQELMGDDAEPLRSLLTWLRNCGADDFKFLSASTEPFPLLFREPEQMTRFLEVCSQLVPDRYVMFHHRLATIQSGGHGFADNRRRHCYQCLDDRVYDSTATYGCVVQLREGGAPIYEHRDPAATKRRKLQAFLRDDRSRDPICREYCFDLYRGLNERVEDLIGPGLTRLAG